MTIYYANRITLRVQPLEAEPIPNSRDFWIPDSNEYLNNQHYEYHESHAAARTYLIEYMKKQVDQLQVDLKRETDRLCELIMSE